MSLVEDLIRRLADTRPTGYASSDPVRTDELIHFASLIEAREKKGERLNTVADLLDLDGHVYSSRPCETCAAVTKLVGRPFGCDRKRAERSKAT